MASQTKYINSTITETLKQDYDNIQNELSSQFEVNRCSIRQFYANKNLFMTGATGFIGKVILEKLLRSCPEIHCIFVLVRGKRNLTINERCDELLDSILFEQVRQLLPGYKQKIVCVRGDLMEPRLGLSDTDIKMLRECVQVVIHSAATVRFDEPLRLALSMNVAATQQLLDVISDFSLLQAYVHVSTAYANCVLEEIEERVYPPAIDCHKLIDALQWMDEDMFDRIAAPLLGAFPNTYTFTKQLAESLVKEASNRGLPACIVRPSIVTSSLSEPWPGWVDNFNGPTGIIAAVGKGLLRSMLGNRAAICDIVPVDMVANLILAAAWRRAQLFEGSGLRELGDISKLECNSGEVPVFHCTSGQVNRFTWGRMEAIIGAYFQHNPMQGCIRVPKGHFTESSAWHQLQLVFNHHMPAILLDSWLYISGRKAMFVRVNQRIQRGVDSMTYFTQHSWLFHSHNTSQLIRLMSVEDRKTFCFDVARIQWDQYLASYLQGIRKFALNEDPRQIESARAHIRKLQRISFIVNCISAVILWRVLVKRVPWCHQIWTLMLSLAVRIYKCLPLLVRAS